MDITGIDSAAKELTHGAIPQITAEMNALQVSVAEDVANATKALEAGVASISMAISSGVDSVSKCLADAVADLLSIAQQLDGAEIIIKIKLGQKLPTA